MGEGEGVGVDVSLEGFGVDVGVDVGVGVGVVAGVGGGAKECVGILRGGTSVTARFEGLKKGRRGRLFLSLLENMGILEMWASRSF